MSTITDARSRRALLGSGLAALGAGIAATLGRAAPVRAEGEAMVVGGEYLTATSRTFLKNATNGADDVFVAVTTGSGKGVWGKNDGGGTGVYGQATNAGYGVQGVSDVGIGVGGTSTSNIAVIGSSVSSFGVLGTSQTNVGVKGISDSHTAVLGVSSSGIGVEGRSDTGTAVSANSGTGVGVEGSTGTGFGILGTAIGHGFAMGTIGRIAHSGISGVATIHGAKTSVTVHPDVSVVAAAFVLLTPNANLGTRSLWYTVKPANDTITIHISSARPTATKIAWILIG